jgi:hypothetical protein
LIDYYGKTINDGLLTINNRNFEIRKMKKKDKDMTVADHLRNFDFYKDLPRELQEPSVSGATGNY